MIEITNGPGDRRRVSSGVRLRTTKRPSAGRLRRLALGLGWAWASVGTALAVDATAGGASAQAAANAPAPFVSQATGQAAPRFRTDRILIRPKPGAAVARVTKLDTAQGRRVLRAFPRFGNVLVLELAAGETVVETVAKYRASGLVEFAEPDYILHASALPDDPKFLDGTQWSLRNTGQGGGVTGADIHAVDGWDVLASASNVVVAVIDTGIRLTHEDLAASLWVNPGEVPGNGIDDDGDGFIDDVHGINAIANSGDPGDDNGHGTHVAGIIGAVGNNQTGIAGVAWHVRLMPCKFLDDTGHGDVANAVACIDYALQHGAQIINASWSNSDYSAALQTALAAAQKAGVIVVAAAGNDNSNNDLVPVYPASLPLDNLVVVAATTSADTLDTNYSNYGASSVTLAAPGTAIYSTWFTNTAAPAQSDSAYAYLSGTSMAAPHVTGALALMRARFSNDSYRQLIARLLAATDPLPTLAGKCLSGGRLNLRKALGDMLLADFTATPSTGPVPLTVHFTNTTVGATATQTWNFGDGSPTVSESNPTHVFQAEGNFAVTLMVTGTNGLVQTRSRVITTVANYLIQPTDYQWIDPSGMQQLWQVLGGLSAVATMPFTFYFYGQPYTQIYINGNGLIGLNDPGFSTVFNADLASASAPNAIVCPYWDALNPVPFLGQGVFVGLVGQSPRRQVVVSWVGVPRLFSFSTTLTFQAILEEGSNLIRFQYLEVEPGNADGGGRQAAVGVRNQTGLIAAEYCYNGLPQTLTNGQALVFIPTSTGGLVVTPPDGLAAAGKLGGPFAPGSLSYTVQNRSASNCAWVVTNTQPWLSLSTAGGVLGSGAATNVLASLNSSATALKAGTYADLISFVNLNNGNGNTTRTVSLAVEGTNSVLSITPEVSLDAIGPPGGAVRAA